MFLLAATRNVRIRKGERLRRLLAAVPAEELVAVLECQRLLPLLGTRALEEHEEVLRPAFAVAVTAALARSRARAAALEALAGAVIGALERAGIESLPLKGVFLARRLYGDPGMRESSDIDLLVDRERLDEAAAVLGELGYEREAGATGVVRRPDLHHRMTNPRAGLPPVELHWRVHWYEQSFSATMLARSVPDGAGMRRPHLDDELAALLLFYARDGFLGLRLATDLGAWWDAYGHERWDTWLAGPLERHPELRRVLLTAAAVSERAVGLPMAYLATPPKLPDRRGVLAAGLANRSQRGAPDQLRANVALVDGLLSPDGQLPAFARRHLLLDDREIEAAYGIPEASRLRRRFWRLAHPPKLLLRFALGASSAAHRVWFRRLRMRSRTRSSMSPSVHHDPFVP